MGNVHRHGGHGYGCDLGSCKNNAMNDNMKWFAIMVIGLAFCGAIAATAISYNESKKHDAPAINYEAVIQSKSDSLERVVQQLQDCRKDLLRQDTIITDQMSQIEELKHHSYRARPPNR